MPNNSRDVVGGLTSRGLMACSLVRLSRGAANVSLPGFTELEDMVKELVRDWKTADHNDNEFVWLATRLGDLCSLIREFDMVEHPDVCTASRKFHRLKDSLDEELKRWPRLGIHGAEHKQRLLDGLNREINQVAELTLLRLALSQAQSSKLHPTDNVISAHEIIDQMPVYDTMYPDPFVPASENTSWLLSPGCAVVTSSARRARLGRVPVMYKTFSSRSNSGVAAQVADAELKYLSRCLHPNVASAIGVTKGYDGLNGYVVATDGIPLDQFLFRVTSGAALIKLIRDIYDLRVNLIADVACEIDVEHVIVKPNGHLTVFPTLAENSGSVYVAPYLGLPENDYAALNPAVQNFLAVYEGYERTMIALLNPRYTGFFDSVVTLDWKTLTGLEIVRLAAKYKLLPDCCIHNWRGLDVPPFTIGIGDIGYALGQDWQVTWNPIEMKPAPDIQYWSYGCECGRTEDGRTHIEGDRWISITLHTCGPSWLGWWQVGHNTISYEQAKQTRAYLRSDRVRVKGARYCTYVSCSLGIDRIGSTKWPSEQLYFHRNPSMRSNPQAFWGFLSTNGDPRSPSINLGEAGLKLARLHVGYDTLCLSDFWDYKYEEMLQSGLASIPGGYLGPYVEEVSEDETTEDGVC